MGLAIFAMLGIPAVVMGRGAFGCATAGLLVTDSTVVIRNPLKNYEVPHSNVLRFKAGEQPALKGHPLPGIVLVQRDGSERRVWTLAREGFVWNSARHVVAWESVADDLNDLVRQAQVQNVAVEDPR